MDARTKKKIKMSRKFLCAWKKIAQFDKKLRKCCSCLVGIAGECRVLQSQSLHTRKPHLALPLSSRHGFSQFFPKQKQKLQNRKAERTSFAFGFWKIWMSLKHICFWAPIFVNIWKRCPATWRNSWRKGQNSMLVLMHRKIPNFKIFMDIGQ